MLLDLNFPHRSEHLRGPTLTLQQGGQVCGQADCLPPTMRPGIGATLGRELSHLIGTEPGESKATLGRLPWGGSLFGLGKPRSHSCSSFRVKVTLLMHKYLSTAHSHLPIPASSPWLPLLFLLWLTHPHSQGPPSIPLNPLWLLCAFSINPNSLAWFMEAWMTVLDLPLIFCTSSPSCF